jgi:hypothetical protein
LRIEWSFQDWIVIGKVSCYRLEALQILVDMLQEAAQAVSELLNLHHAVIIATGHFNPCSHSLFIALPRQLAKYAMHKPN